MTEWQAHKLRGAASQVGDTALSALAHKMEEAAKANDQAALQSLQLELEQCFARLKEARGSQAAPQG